MALLSLIAVLLLEHYRPLPYQRAVHVPLTRIARFLMECLDAGERRHALMAWTIATGVPVLAVLAIHLLLNRVSPLLGWLWTAFVVYLTLGFGQFGRNFNSIETALRLDDLAMASRLLGEWRGRSAEGLSAREISRLSIKEVVLASYRHFFAVLFCLVVLPGPCGAVLYRMAAFLAECWGNQEDPDRMHFAGVARQFFAIIDWLPARFAATGFAIVGNFEDALYCWRMQAENGQREPSSGHAGVVLASAGGALGICLDGTSADSGGAVSLRAADVDAMPRVVGLIWRAMLLWLLVLFLLSLATLVG